MKRMLLLLLLVVFIFNSGCTETQPSMVEEIEINCDSFSPQPELKYYKIAYTDFDAEGYHLYYDFENFQSSTYEIETYNPYTKKPCHFGEKEGENVNYLYCSPLRIEVQEISDKGEILSKKTLNIYSTYSIDKSINREYTGASNDQPLDGEEIIEQRCTIST